MLSRLTSQPFTGRWIGVLRRCAKALRYSRVVVFGSLAIGRYVAGSAVDILGIKQQRELE